MNKGEEQRLIHWSFRAFGMGISADQFLQLRRHAGNLQRLNTKRANRGALTDAEEARRQRILETVERIADECGATGLFIRIGQDALGAPFRLYMTKAGRDEGDAGEGFPVLAS